MDKTRFEYNEISPHCVAQTVALRRHILFMRPCKANANHSKPFSLLGGHADGNCSRLWRTRIIRKEKSMLQQSRDSGSMSRRIVSKLQNRMKRILFGEKRANISQFRIKKERIPRYPFLVCLQICNLYTEEIIVQPLIAELGRIP